MESTDKLQTASNNVKVDVLKEENDQLQNKLHEQLEEAKQKDLELQKLKAALVQKDGQLNVYKYQTPDYSRKEEKVFLTKPIFYGMIAVLVSLAALAAYSFLIRKDERRLHGIITYADTSKDGALLDPTDSILMDIKPTNTSKTTNNYKSSSKFEQPSNEVPLKVREPSRSENLTAINSKKRNSGIDEPVTATSRKPHLHIVVPEKPVSAQTTEKPDKQLIEEPKKKLSVANDEDPTYVELPPQGKYYVNVSRAYLYDQPDMKTKGYFYMVPSNNSILFSLDEKNGFIFVEFKSSQGLELRGWIKISDLVKIN